jgi:hypothetical protein
MDVLLSCLSLLQGDVEEGFNMWTPDDSNLDRFLYPAPRVLSHAAEFPGLQNVKSISFSPLFFWAEILGNQIKPEDSSKKKRFSSQTKRREKSQKPYVNKTGDF